MGRLMVCFEYISLRLVPSSETAQDPSLTGYMSAEPGRPIIDIGGDCSTMDGSPGLLNGRGETEFGMPVSGLTMGDRYPLPYGVL